MEVQENFNIADHAAKEHNVLLHIVKAMAEKQLDRLLMQEIETGHCLTYGEFDQGALQWSSSTIRLELLLPQVRRDHLKVSCLGSLNLNGYR